MDILERKPVVTALMFYLILPHWSKGITVTERTENSTENSAHEKRNSPDVEEVEKRVLQMFGMSRRPLSGRKLRIPRLMQHLYKAHMGDYFHATKHHLAGGLETGFDLPPSHVTSRINTARSFHHIGEFASFIHCKLLFEHVTACTPNDIIKNSWNV